MLKVENSKGLTYNFDDKEIQLILMWAYGYMDLGRTGYLPIDLDTGDLEINNFMRKFSQCLDGEYKIYEKTKRMIE